MSGRRVTTRRRSLDLDALRRYGILVDGEIPDGVPKLFLQISVSGRETCNRIAMRRGCGMSGRTQS
ncbi:hypothetical protein ABXT21_23030 [Ralstonia sp. SM1864_UCD524_TZ4]|uniref:Uncharacterized protein n=1 Tax=Ralstonia solanacearum TaxID=305 RepID=A0A0S4W765_RALSL|nr:hypothetical protein [Ralstonia pseudosolanacearum]CUV26523.1 conserved protein of unknown function [Ralstonia solanacearum]MCK4153656.1 hypothetical protein [Ralstonia pseudosolanacearum]MCL1618127.1 hypothetical protein [Ralstonia pseudosolanacearum CaRs-Mep]MCQ4682362.1 hypothetical protein [Ralstonia pseudosolanacearum]MDC6295653.1 hypothetical protein [Ralstonia pseudosolanacearum]